MANREHLKVVRNGRDAIDEWWVENPGVMLDLTRAKLSGLDLNEANLYRANLHGAELSAVNLQRANLQHANLTEATLNEANLYRTNFGGATFRRAKLVRSDLGKANMAEAVLVGANMIDAILIKTDLSNASLQGADFTGTHSKNTLWIDLDLSQTVGLGSVFHSGPSTIGVDTLMKSKGQIPEIFLRGCGLLDDFISYIPSHFSGSVIDFYSCFISYSHEDKSFARRLHDALQGRGIRCWLDEHQILPGDNIYDRIDHGIRVWDKVLLCASRNSLTSGWVDDELKHAFAKEKQLFKDRGNEVLSLVPLNLDGYLFSDWNHPKKNQVLERMAPDFTGWESDNAKFEQQFERVVKALQTNNAGREPEPKSKL